MRVTSSNFSLWLIVIAGFVSGLFSPVVHATATFGQVDLGQASPSGLNLGIFVTGPTQINASNSMTDFNTNMGLANGASTNFSGGGTLTGILYKDPGATVQSNISQQFNVDGGIKTQSLAQAVTDVKNAATNAAMLTPNQTFGSLGSSATTFTPSGMDTTILINGNINITNPSNDLTINGLATDYYIIDVTGSVTVTNGAIQTSGGIPASHILFNVEGTGNSVNLSNGTSVLTGTYLAPFANQKITISPGTVNGAIIGYQIQTSSGPTINGAPFPEPSSLSLMGMGAMALLARRRRA